MAGKKTSKNSPTNKSKKQTGRMVMSSECENCENKCSSGIAYLKVFELKHEGKGVYCNK